MWSALPYLRKLFFKKRSAPSEEVRYFDRQRQILRHLWQSRAAAGDARLALVGDIMWIRDGWGSFLDPGVREYLNAHDAVVGNLKSVISPRFKVKSFWPDYYTPNSHPDPVRAFRRPDVHLGEGKNFRTVTAAADGGNFERTVALKGNRRPQFGGSSPGRTFA